MSSNLKKISALNTIDSSYIGPDDLFYMAHKAPGQYLSFNVKLKDIFVGANAVTTDMKFLNNTLFITNGKIGINNTTPETELDVNGGIYADGVVRFTKNETSTSITTGSVRIVGGIGISGDIYAGSLQDTLIGSDVPSNAFFLESYSNTAIISTLTVTGDSTTGKITASSIQNSPIGTITKNTGAFTALSSNDTVSFTKNAASTSTTTGTLIVTGGIGVSGAIYAGGIQNTPIGNTVRNTGAFTTLTANNTTTLTAGVGSTSTTSGTLIVTGGIGVSENLYANNINIVNQLTCSEGIFNTLQTSVLAADTFVGSINNTPIGSYSANTGSFSTLTAYGATNLSANTNSTSSYTGTLVVTGGVGVSGDMYAGSIQDTPIGSSKRSSGAFTSLTANNVVTFNSGEASANTTSGAVVVTGGLGVSGNISTNSCAVNLNLSSLNGTFVNLDVENLTANNMSVSNLSLGNVTAIMQAFLTAVYPVGSLYYNGTNSSNPNTILGFRTWEAYAKGRVLVGVNPTDSDFDDVGAMGGEKAHTLTIDEMPSHTHTYVAATSFGNSDDDGGWNPVKDLATKTSSAIGGSQPHNNLQPYITCYIWIRTA